MVDQSPAPATLSESVYANRVLPAREQPYEVLGTLLGAAAIVAAGLVLIIPPFKAGFLAIALATLAVAVGGERARLPKAAMAIAGIAWLAAGIVAVIRDTAVW